MRSSLEVRRQTVCQVLGGKVSSCWPPFHRCALFTWHEDIISSFYKPHSRSLSASAKAVLAYFSLLRLKTSPKKRTWLLTSSNQRETLWTAQVFLSRPTFELSVSTVPNILSVCLSLPSPNNCLLERNIFLQLQKRRLAFRFPLIICPLTSSPSSSSSLFYSWLFFCFGSWR